MGRRVRKGPPGLESALPVQVRRLPMLVRACVRPAAELRRQHAWLVVWARAWWATTAAAAQPLIGARLLTVSLSFDHKWHADHALACLYTAFAFSTLHVVIHEGGLHVKQE